MATHCILVTTSSFGSSDCEALDCLARHNLRPVLNPFGRKLTEDELEQLVREHQPIGLLAGTEPITKRIFAAGASTLRTVSRVGVGWDNVEHESARAFGVLVTRTAGVLDQCVAELAVGFMLSALRNLPQHTGNIRQGVWKKTMGALLQGKHVGIIGYGSIGRKVASLVTAFDAIVHFFDPYAETGDECPHSCMQSLAELCSLADIISIHASAKVQLLGRAELALCKHGVGIVNTARGGQIDEQALYEGLVEQRIGWACLDVFEQEPYNGPLTELPNVILSPHIGSYATEARRAMENAAVANLLRALGLEGD